MDQPLLSLRTTLVFLLASLAGATTGILTALAGEGAPRSVLGGLAAAGLAVPFFNHLIASEPDQGRQRGHAGVGDREGNGRG
ncbi:hypothetical protein [Streptomyces sp. XD-27]|uniref:hypothetical protein n=1 Tax=Streptomyces sp. XD-27 TaxID=3062779 RepID=UPI0026F4764D|nr:hypothetical protein [Streptomyces sp. XD-27]WKX69047.1 hypothetical protein Q3Y56_03155 [Streptomyces sp. XD-27]